MLRNLSAGSINTDNSGISLATYLHSITQKPSHIAGLLAIFILPSAALGWWYYSFAMSVGAVTPLRLTNDTSSAMTPVESPMTPAPLGSESTSDSVAGSQETSAGDIDMNLNSSTSQSSVEVNGQSVPVPSEGTTHQVIKNDNGQTTVDISVNSNTSGSSKTRSSTDVNISSSSSADVDVSHREGR